MSKQKVCLVYKNSEGNLIRTRFHKPTSKRVLERKAAILSKKGKKPELMKRKIWEYKMGPINGEPSSAIVPRDLRFVEKTHEMKAWCHQHYKKNGAPLAY